MLYDKQLVFVFSSLLFQLYTDPFMFFLLICIYVMCYADDVVEELITSLHSTTLDVLKT